MAAPADVCAATNTFSPHSIRTMPSFWKLSSSNGHVIARRGRSASNAAPRLATLFCSANRYRPCGSG